MPGKRTYLTLILDSNAITFLRIAMMICLGKPLALFDARYFLLNLLCDMFTMHKIPIYNFKSS